MSEGFPVETSASGQTPQKSGGGPLKIILIVIVLLAGMSMLCCCGVFGVFFVQMGQNANKVKTRFENDTVVQDVLGGIDTCAFNFGETVSESQNKNGTMVFDVEGPKGSGQLVIYAPGGDPSNPESAALRQGGADFPLNFGDSDAFTPPF